MVFIDEERLKKAFLEDVTEHLDKLNEALLDLENDFENKELINDIFRHVHSIKSEAALIGYKRTEKVAHKMEDIFGRLREGKMSINLDIMNALFAGYDRITELIAAIQGGLSEDTIEIDDVLKPLFDILNEKMEAAKATQSAKSTQTAKAEESGEKESFETHLEVKRTTIKSLDNIEFSEVEQHSIEESLESGERLYRIIYRLEDECDMRYPRAYLVYNNFAGLGNVIKSIPDINTETEEEKYKQVLLYISTGASVKELVDCADVDQVVRLDIGEFDTVALKEGLKIEEFASIDSIVTAQEVDDAETIEREWARQIEANLKMDEGGADRDDFLEAEGKSSSARPRVKKELQRQTIRVDIERLDNLLNLVGELIINRSRFIQIKDKTIDEASIQELRTELEDATNELERITDQMQMGMMQARMVPIGNVFSKFPRMVRDLANELHKNVNLEIYGESTEIDRTVIELIADPLTHLIRNSIDHGIEPPDVREASGKPREAKAVLKAYQEGSNIIIEVIDDGKGIDTEKIKERIVERGLVSRQKVGNLTQSEILNYIFEPGFSTKEQVTNLSGRGVGMDVVKTQIQKLRGRVEIFTRLGEGTRTMIVLPLTTTILEALLVQVRNNIFAIPISVVEETIKVNRDEIKEFDDYQVYNLRNETLAILFLSDLVGIDEREESKEIYIVVVSFDGRRVGLVVTDLMGEQDIVIKALDEVLKNNDGIAGAAVLGGDGRIALILDTNTLVKSSLKELDKLQRASGSLSNEEMGEALSSFYDQVNVNDRASTAKKRKAPQVVPEQNLPELAVADDDEDPLKVIKSALDDIRE